MGRPVTPIDRPGAGVPAAGVAADGGGVGGADGAGARVEVGVEARLAVDLALQGKNEGDIKSTKIVHRFPNNYDSYRLNKCKFTS